MKYLRSTTFGCKDTGIRKSEIRKLNSLEFEFKFKFKVKYKFEFKWFPCKEKYHPLPWNPHIFCQLLVFLNKRIFIERNWVFVTNRYFLIPKSLHSDCVNFVNNHYLIFWLQILIPREKTPISFQTLLRLKFIGHKRTLF